MKTIMASLVAVTLFGVFYVAWTVTAEAVLRQAEEYKGM